MPLQAKALPIRLKFDVQGDSDGDGIGDACDVPGQVGAIPEPATLILFGLGVCGIFILVRRRQNMRR